METLRLGFEAHSVIGLRLTKVALGGVGARDETQLMIAEKSKAAWDANLILTRSLLAGKVHLAPAPAPWPSTVEECRPTNGAFPGATDRGEHFT